MMKLSRRSGRVAPRAEPPRATGVGREDPAERGAIGSGGVDGEPLPLLGKDRAQAREGHAGLDRDGHVGRRVVDHLVQGTRVDRDPRGARHAAVVEGGPPPLRIDREALRDPVRHGSRGITAGRSVAEAWRPEPSVRHPGIRAVQKRFSGRESVA